MSVTKYLIYCRMSLRLCIRLALLFLDGVEVTDQKVKMMGFHIDWMDELYAELEENMNSSRHQLPHIIDGIRVNIQRLRAEVDAQAGAHQLAVKEAVDVSLVVQHAWETLAENKILLHEAEDDLNASP